MANYTMVYISEHVIYRINETPFGKYLDNVCCMTHNRKIVYRINDRTLRKIQREYKKELKEGLIKILD